METKSTNSNTDSGQNYIGRDNDAEDSGNTGIIDA
jgi:hypothetical protein